MHFSLRTLLAVITAVAVYVGYHLGMIRTLHGRGVASVGTFLMMLHRLPLFVIWTVAVAHLYPQRRTLPYANWVLAAVATSMIWLFLSPFLQVIFRAMFGPNYLTADSVYWFSSVQMILDATIEATSWGLLLYAYLMITRSREQAPSSAE